MTPDFVAFGLIANANEAPNTAHLTAMHVIALEAVSPNIWTPEDAAKRRPPAGFPPAPKDKTHE